MNKQIQLLIFILTSVLFDGCFPSNSLPLDGIWQVTLDAGNEMLKNHPGSKTGGEIALPGSLVEAGFGVKTSGSDYGHLTPEYKYIGKALYEKEINIPPSWKERNVELFLERVLWESRIYIDNKELSVQDALGTPHRHTLGKLDPGPHKLVIQVDNDVIHNIGDKGHGYGDDTQSIWNGVVGKMELRASDDLYISGVRTFSDVHNDELRVDVTVNAVINNNAKISHEILSLSTGKTVIKSQHSIQMIPGENSFEFNFVLRNKLKKWSEFTPEVYILKTRIKSKHQSDTHETEFGFMEVSHNGTKIVINDKPVFLRGNLDCVHFPITGYPSCDVEDWERIFKIYKDYGLNHVRFHSWCPPEAAFKAANRVGIYVQAEASVWIDQWMMDTKGYPKGLGYDTSRDSFIVAEMNRVVGTYGNHPSFIMFCIGNELGNSDFNVMKTWVDELKQGDPRRLYSVSTARKITDIDDYSATHYIQGIGRTRGLNGPRTDWDFEDHYGKMDIPIIAHEIGQWPVYPVWSEIEKYSGVLKARNFEKFKLIAEQNGIADQDVAFRQASGALNQLMYKYEIESFLRTPSCAGIQLLSMQDYQGQGEALIGWLDCHWDSKTITTPEEFREHCNTTVPLLRMKKFVWENNEIFNASVQVSHQGSYNMEAACTWRIVTDSGMEMAKGEFEIGVIEVGKLTDLGKIRFNLSSVTTAQKLRVEVDVLETEYRNSWEFWVYPHELSEFKNSDVMVVNDLTDEVVEHLQGGAKVLLVAHDMGTEATTVDVNFYPLYWSLTYFPGQGKTNLGMVIKNEHPALAAFPTDSHSNWQWESICKDSKGFILNRLSVEYKPIVQPIDDFHRNNKIGAIFECKMGDGKLLVCGFNLNQKGSPVANQLKYSLLRFMNSGDFDPKYHIEPEFIKGLFLTMPAAD